MNKKNAIQFITTVFLLFGNSCISPTETQDESITVTHLPDSVYLSQGTQIAGTVFATLSGELMKNMQEGGVVQAVKYCNIQAYPLTDSLSKALGAKIRRTSHKVRNPENRSDSLEATMIVDFLDKQTKGTPIKPQIVVTSDDKRHFFAPIVLAKPCLQCHGEVGKDIKAENYELIKSLYPEDRAVEFAEGDLRGLWSIEFEELRSR